MTQSRTAEDKAIGDHLLADADDLLGWLATAIALTRDGALQAAVRKNAGVGEAAPLAINLPETGAWIELEHGSRARVRREPTPGLPAHRFDVDDAAAVLRRELAAAIQRTDATAEASARLTPLFDTAGSPTREDIVVLFEWAPVLERIAYRYYARAIVLLDEMRPQAQFAAAGEADAGRAMSTYWSGLHAASHLCLLAAGAEAMPWLADLAALSPPSGWTPSLPLVRERTLWLAAVGARSAAAFGESAIPLYAAALASADHPLKLFDALLGLAAIAMSHPPALRSVAAAIRTERRSVREPMQAAVTEALVQAALSAIEGDYGRRAVRSADPAPPDIAFLNPISLRLDPLTPLPSGRPFAFSALPALMRTAIPHWYPPGWRVNLRLASADMAEVLTRAAGGAGTPARTHLVH
jgi:hypothetical protein